MLGRRFDIFRAIASKQRVGLACFHQHSNEFIRHGNPAIGLFRRTSRDVRLGNVMIPKDSTVWIAYLARNYDAAQFPEPARLGNKS
ncbi:MAG: cytochrome P450 [Leptolyngbyaceae cyanobacterium RM2_2_4]|nr:cytochrome P450 [Leptolyngbyaceae cyanobacterium RM2_2_4]